MGRRVYTLVGMGTGHCSSTRRSTCAIAYIPYDVVQDDQVVALVQVTSPDADLSEIPENWDIIDFAEKSDYPDEDPSDYNSEVQDEEFYPNPDSEIDEDQDSYQEPDDYDYDPDMRDNNDSYSEPDDYQEYYSDS